MLERLNPVLKLVCLGLAAFLLYRVSQIAMLKNPLDDLNLPPIASTNSVSATNAPPGDKSTNASAGKNAAAAKGQGAGGPGTNTQSGVKGSNALAAAKGGAVPPPGMPGPGMARAMGGPGMRGGMPGMPGMGGPPGGSAFLPAIQSRIDRIIESEILGPVPRPLPMALLGIAGKFAFMRAPNGQTDLMNEGGELGGLKLLRIGTNRVLVEHEGQQKELTIFSGYGSDSLLPKGKDH